MGHPPTTIIWTEPYQLAPNVVLQQLHAPAAGMRLNPRSSLSGISFVLFLSQVMDFEHPLTHTIFERRLLSVGTSLPQAVPATVWMILRSTSQLANDESDYLASPLIGTIWALDPACWNK